MSDNKEDTYVREYLSRDIARLKSNSIPMIPIMHNTDVVYLQMCGWSINLKPDGTWCTEVTEGG